MQPEPIGEERQEPPSQLDEPISSFFDDARAVLSSIKVCVATLLQRDVELSDETERELLEVIDSESDRLTMLVREAAQSYRSAVT